MTSKATSCLTDAECSDGIACTSERCLTGRCVRLVDPNACPAGSSCDLRALGCVRGEPCTDNADCRDSDPCTTSEMCGPNSKVCLWRALDADRDYEVAASCGGSDCDDSSGKRSSTGTEVCNGRDDDCDGVVDDSTVNLCSPDKSCVSGSCQCNGGLSLCKGACVDTKSDEGNCGGCGKTCIGGKECNQGLCVCPLGTKVCKVSCQAQCPCVNKSCAVITDVAVGAQHACAITDAKQVFCWGRNQHGQLGVTGVSESLVPVLVQRAQGGLLSNVVELALGDALSCARTETGEVYCWGNNSYGAVGDGTTTPRSAATRVIVRDTQSGMLAELGGAASITVNNDVTACATTTSGAGYCWGALGSTYVGKKLALSTVSRVGLASLAPSSGRDLQCYVASGLVECTGYGVFENLQPARSITAASGALANVARAVPSLSSCAMTTSGAVFCWSLASQATALSLAEGGALTNAVDLVAADDTACAVTGVDKQVRCWGEGTFGELGHGAPADSPTAVNVMTNSGALSGVLQIALTDRSACTRTTAGLVYCWGRNESGQLSIGNHTAQTRAVQAGTGPDHPFQSITKIAGRGSNFCAIQSNGELFCWGKNDYGQIGDRTKLERLRAKRVVFPQP